MTTIGSVKAFFGLDPTPAKKGMKEAESAIRKGSKNVNTSLQSIKRTASSIFVGWKVKQLGQDFANAAMDMDSMRRSMGAAVGGMEKGAKEINYLRQESQKLGLSFKDQIKDYKMLSAAAKGTALEGAGIRKVWRSLQDATVALQMTTAETSGTIYAFKDMLSKGTVQAEELKRQLGNRLPGAFKLAADAMNMTTKELAIQMKQGKIMADVFLPNLAKAMTKTYGGAALTAAKAMRSELNRLKNSYFVFQTTFMEVSGASDILTKALKKVTKQIDSVNEAMMRGTVWAEIFASVGAQAEIMGVKVKNIFGSMGKEMGIRAETPIEIKNKYDEISGYYDSELLVAKQQNFTSKVSASFQKAGDAFQKDKKGFLWKVAKKMTLPGMFGMTEDLGVSVEKDTAAYIKKEKEINEKKWRAYKEAGVGDFAKALQDNKQNNDKAVEDQIKSIEKKRDALLLKLSNKKIAETVLPDDIAEDYTKAPIVDKWAGITAELSTSFAKIETQSSDVAKNIASAFTSAFSAIEDALVQMVTKGKVDWRSLADSIISDMVRIAYKQQILAPIMGAFSSGAPGIGTWLGSLSGVSMNQQMVSGTSAIGSTPMAPMAMANGGVVNEHIKGIGMSSGRSYDIGEAGQEFVLNKSQMKDISGNKGMAISVSPNINISTPPGTQATTTQSGDGMNMDIMITAIESKLAQNGRRGGGPLANFMEQTYGVNRSYGASR